MEDLKMKIKKHLMAVYIFIMPVTLICGCGARYASGGSGVNIQHTTVCKESSTNVAKEAKADKQEIKKKNNKDLYKKIPVYGQNEKKKIKKYLASLPDDLTVKEAKKRGIVIETYKTYKKKSPFYNIWMDFYKFTRRSEKMYEGYEKELVCTAEPCEAAIVILRHTVEGDACYTYISFIGDRYYVFNDSSRDKFKAGSWDGYNEAGTFKSLRKSEKIIYSKENNKSYLYTRYLLFKKKGISRKKVNQIIKNNNGNNKYYDIFGYRTISQPRSKS